MKAAICPIWRNAIFANVASGDVGEGDDKGGDIGGGAGHASFVKSFFRDFVEDMGIEDKFPAERTVELMIVRAVVRPGDLLDVPSGKFMC